MGKMFKLCAVVCMLVCILFFAFSVYAAEGDIEIKFAVGDSTLSINGEDVTVTTPYVVEGTTLVPVRVITEAFGAEVAWNGEEQAVTINYSDVEIKLTIGNKTAYINGNAIELLAAPELTNSTTMLPLRFITESFGADVTYDEATAKIMVVKETVESNSIKDYSLILKRSDKEFVGDSYHNWSMTHSPELKLSYRSFDGRKNIFTNDDETGIVAIDALTYEEGETIDDVYATIREELKNMSVSKFEKTKTASGVEYVVAQYSTNEVYCEVKAYIKDKAGILLTIEQDIESGRDKFTSLMDITASFDMNFNEDKTEDLSDVDKTTGYHTYKSDYMGIEIDIPGYLYLFENDANKNNVYFADVEENPVSIMSVNFYSSYDGHDAKTWAEKDLEYNKRSYNEKYTKFSEIFRVDVGGKTAYTYNYTINYRYGVSKTTYDIFVQAGDYFYNIAIVGEEDKIFDIKNEILESVVFKEVDKEKVGQLMRIDDGEDINYKDYEWKSAEVKFKVPSTWNEVSRDNTSLSLENDEEGFSMNLTFAIKTSLKTEYEKILTLKEFSNYLYDIMKKEPGVVMIEKNTKSVKVGEQSGYYYSYTLSVEDEKFAGAVYVVNAGNKYLVIQLMGDEYTYGERTKEIFSDIIESVDC